MNGHRLILALIIVALIGGIIAVAFRAHSASPEICADTKALVAVMRQQHGEDEAAYGLMPSGKLLRLFASADGKTWTIVFSSAEGLSCLIASGADWTAVVGARGSL